MDTDSTPSSFSDSDYQDNDTSPPSSSTSSRTLSIRSAYNRISKYLPYNSHSSTNGEASNSDPGGSVSAASPVKQRKAFSGKRWLGLRKQSQGKTEKGPSGAQSPATTDKPVPLKKTLSDKKLKLPYGAVGDNGRADDHDVGKALQRRRKPPSSVQEARRTRANHCPFCILVSALPASKPSEKMVRSPQTVAGEDRKKGRAEPQSPPLPKLCHSRNISDKKLTSLRRGWAINGGADDHDVGKAVPARRRGGGRGCRTLSCPHEAHSVEYYANCTLAAINHNYTSLLAANKPTPIHTCVRGLLQRLSGHTNTH
uniref:Uncharacterized protein n=1 Tax=Heliothis virescens TaxID=7102 RepID=A0A2A4K3M7_HELVI